ncbi:hypothetical protein [Luteimicrobium subarcticum]|uniref:Uncharacterized protein n=1 Tax=Luteimicrobium subarcticum TaxID=620910 RepID=A0A2M8WVL9_9MICO|nr:hypothetical protein [Luteimicrobium subarcticum]PJI94975.1 hypothetical protein CLV34_0827 [Luteimicrobium subarcticum]
MNTITCGERGPVRISPTRRALRTVGYLTTAVTWTALWLVVLGLAWAIPVYGIVSGDLTVHEITRPATSSVGGFVGLVLVGLPAFVAVWGPGVLWVLPCATWPLAALSGVYVLRSLRPSYAAEPLSRSERTELGETIGPPATTGATLSLLPVRRSRATDLLMAFYLAGWKPDGRTAVAMLPAGVAYVLMFGAIAVDVGDGARLVCGVLAGALAAGSYGWALVLLRRRSRPLGEDRRWEIR